MGEKHRVRFEPVGIEIEVDEEQTVLRAASEQGLMLMHGCKEGQCAACKSFVLDGDDIELDRYSTFALPDYEKEEGFTLLCRAHVYEDVTIELLNYDEEIPVEVDLPVVWAALDCPGGWTAMGDGRTYVLGRIAVDAAELPEPGSTCVVMGEAVEVAGRKAKVLSTLYAPDGRRLAKARATWIATTLVS